MPSVLAHLNEYDIVVPVAVQTPELRQTLAAAFEAAGLTLESFVVGSPTQAINSETGYPEF